MDVAELRIEPSARVTLADLVDLLEQPLLQVVSAPSGTSAALGPPVLWDGLSEADIRTGSLVLALGARPETDAGLDLVRRAGSAGACAVAFKCDGDPPSRLVEAATREGTALLIVATEADWGDVYAYARSITARADTSSSSRFAPSDLFGLADAVARMVGGAVTIEDTSNRVLAYSTTGHPVDETRRETILARRAPESCIRNHQADGVLRRLAMSDEPLRVDSRGCDHPPRLAIGLRVGHEMLGSIWVAQGEEPFTDDTLAALGRAAPVVTVRLAARRLAESVERRRRAAVVQSLLEGRGTARAVAATIGIDPEAPIVVAAVRPADDAWSPTTLERALGYVALYCESSSSQNVCLLSGPVIYLLQPLGQSSECDAVNAVLEELVRQAPTALRFPLVAGVGSAVPRLADIRQSRDEADRVLQVLLSQRAESRVATFGQLRSQATLVSLIDLVRHRPEYGVERIERLQAMDERRGTCLLATLRAYISEVGDIGVASRRMRVHPNTFRYRLKRVAELIGADLHNADDMFVLQLELRLFDAQLPRTQAPSTP